MLHRLPGNRQDAFCPGFHEGTGRKGIVIRPGDPWLEDLDGLFAKAKEEGPSAVLFDDLDGAYDDLKKAYDCVAKGYFENGDMGLMNLDVAFKEEMMAKPSRFPWAVSSKWLIPTCGSFSWTMRAISRKRHAY